MSAELTEAERIWKDGSFVAWKDATVHLLSTAVQFGSSVFEGIRCYDTPDGPAVFRLDAHVRRLLDSATIYRMRPRWDHDALARACLDTVRENGLKDCYIRPMILRGYGAAGLYAPTSPIETWVAAWPWGAYLGEEALQEGVDVCVSSWSRPRPNTFPTAAKAAGHYNNAQLMKMEAVANGFTEAIALGPGGMVSEGSGQNVFLVRDGVVITPSLDGTSLAGITRHAVLTIAKELGHPIREQQVPREALYVADELFFTGTATEVTPIRSVDRVEIGGGKGGPVTLAIQERFLRIARGEADDPWGWRTPVS